MGWALNVQAILKAKHEISIDGLGYELGCLHVLFSGGTFWRKGILLKHSITSLDKMLVISITKVCVLMIQAISLVVRATIVCIDHELSYFML